MRKIFIIFFLIPPLLLVVYMFSGVWRYPNILPETLTLRSVSFLIKNLRELLLSLLSSIIYSIITVFLSFLLTVLPASLLARWDFKFRLVIEALLLSPVLIPAITFSMGIHWIYIKIGLSDSYIGVITVLTMFSYPYMLKALISGFMLYDPLFDSCAKNLGANLLIRVLKIHIPLLRPSIFSGGTVVFLSSFSSYFLVFLIGGGRVRSFSGYLIPFLKSEDHNISSLLSIIFLIIPLALFLIIEKFMRSLKYEKAS